MKSMSVTVSAPGKILLAGGYLVLEETNVGVVVAVDRRFYTTLESQQGSERVDTLDITVHSVQFDQIFQYSYLKSTHTLTGSQGNAPNAFLSKTLSAVLLYVINDSHDTLVSLKFTIRADNDFYSLIPHLRERNLPRTGASALPRFLPVVKIDNQSTAKTGLGSSACLVTSMVGALCHLLIPEHLKSSTEPTIEHLSQLAHCSAQGKIGSGFDVSAAVYGSHSYRRFPMTTLSTILGLMEHESALPHDIRAVVDAPWSGGVVGTTSLPAFLQVALADVSGGSESPSMAKKVMEWRRTAHDISPWTNLARLNQRVASILQQLCNVPVSDELCQRLASLSVENWRVDESTVGKLLYALHVAFQETRAQMRAIGEASHVPLEPPSQTRLADATVALPGVVAALVPGAGGYDALACVYVKVESVKSAIADLWGSYDELQVCPLNVQAIPFGDGLRVEAVEPM